MDLVFRPERYPFLTQDLPGVGGEIRVEPEDFQVEEVPAYLPKGRGSTSTSFWRRRAAPPGRSWSSCGTRWGCPRRRSGWRA